MFLHGILTQASNHPTTLPPPCRHPGRTIKFQATKKELKAAEDEYADKFGGFVEDEYEEFTSEYDDFM